MKKSVIFTILLVITSVAMFSCDDDKEKTLVSIVVTTPPSKTIYTVGEVFDPAGMVVTATFSNGDTETINISLLTITDGNFSETGARTVTIAFTYDGVTVTTTVSVTVNAPEVVLLSIAVTSQPTKKEYFVGDAFDPAGMAVTATYSDQSTVPVAITDEMLDYDFSAAGENKTVTITYEGKIATVSGITVNTASAKIVSVGAPIVTLITPSIPPFRVTHFPVNTVNVEDGNYTATLDNRPTGVSLQSNIRVEKSTSILSLNIYDQAQAGTYSDLRLTIDGTSSMAFTLIVSETVTFEGNGGFDNPYLIGTAEQLAKIAEIVNVYNRIYRQLLGSFFTLTADINLGVAPYNTGKGWTPIGKFDSDPNAFVQHNLFNGTFDGKGKTISGLYINDSELDYVGLFSMGNVRNLNLIGVNITGKNNIGSVAGSGSPINCFVSGVVNGKDNVGGIVGIGGATNCYSAVTVSGNNKVGGIAGMVVSVDITNSYVTGAVSGNSDVGGIAGDFRYGSQKVENCVALNPSVKAAGTHNMVGRIAGKSYGTGNFGVGNFGGNLAFIGMGTDGGAPFPPSGVNENYHLGEDVSAANAKTQKTYEDLGWKFGNDDDNPWKWVGGSYPLPVLYWQETYPTLPEHLK